MKNLLNDLSYYEKQRILEQYENSIFVETSKFKKLMNSKLGNVKPLISEQSNTQPISNLSSQDKKTLWNKITTQPVLKQHLQIMPHHTEHNFLEQLGHKLHFHVDPQTKHAQIQFPGLGKEHNVQLNVGFSYQNHSNHDDKHEPTPSIPHSVGDIGLTTTFGSSKKTQPLKPF